MPKVTSRVLLDVTFSALSDDSVQPETLRACISRAQDAAATIEAGVDRISALVRHGSGDYGHPLHG